MPNIWSPHRCIACNRFNDGKIKAAPDPDHPAFLVCNRKSCFRERAKLNLSARLAKYEARLVEEKQRMIANMRFSARDQHRRELESHLIDKCGPEAVKFAKQLAQGWVCPCQDHQVSEAARGLVENAARINALTDDDLDALADEYLRQQNAQDLRHSRYDYSCQYDTETHYSPHAFGSYMGAMTPAHAEVRRVIADAHGGAWTEMNLVHHGGVQSWFAVRVGSWGVEDEVITQLKIIDAVAIADTQPIPAKRCDGCGKCAGLDYERRRYSTRGIFFTLCSRPECIAKRDRVFAKTGVPIPQYLLDQRRRNEKCRALEPYPAPGPLPESTVSYEPDLRLRLAEFERQLKYTSEPSMRDKIQARRAQTQRQLLELKLSAQAHVR